jgi:uncharacterized damage-inducible protein DinB
MARSAPPSTPNPQLIALTRDLYAYSAWANRRVLDAAARLAPERYAAEVPGAGSIRDILVHIASAQWTWLERWRGASPGPWDPTAFPDVATLRTRWAEVEAETEAFVSDLDATDFERKVSYVNYAGEPWAYPLGRQLLHQVNHATQHRSEAALLLTQAGHSPGWLDFLVYVDELNR